MIKREEAVDTLYALINSNVLDEELCDKIENIASCIGSERDGLHLWGADDQEVAELYTTVRSDAADLKEHENLCDMLYQKYCFEPSEFEMPEFMAQLEESEEQDG